MSGQADYKKLFRIFLCLYVCKQCTLHQCSLHKHWQILSKTKICNNHSEYIATVYLFLLCLLLALMFAGMFRRVYKLRSVRECVQNTCSWKLNIACCLQKLYVKFKVHTDPLWAVESVSQSRLSSFSLGAVAAFSGNGAAMAKGSCGESQNQPRFRLSLLLRAFRDLWLMFLYIRVMSTRLKVMVVGDNRNLESERN